MRTASVGNVIRYGSTFPRRSQARRRGFLKSRRGSQNHVNMVTPGCPYLRYVRGVHIFMTPDPRIAEERVSRGLVTRLHSSLAYTSASRLNQNVVFQQWKAPRPLVPQVSLARKTNHDHARGRTEKSSKANAAQEALNYIAEHEPEMQHLFLFQSLAAWERQSFWSAGDRW